MDEKRIQIQQSKNVNSVNIDQFDQVYLESNRKNLEVYDIIESVNVSDQFETERQNTLNFKIYGGVEYFSMINNVVTNYKVLEDFFSKQIRNGATKTITNSFDIYLVKPYTAYTQVNTTKFVKQYQVVATLTDLDIIDAGFSRNVFFEKKNILMFSKAFETYDLLDGFGKPLTEFYLYFNYKSSTNGFGVAESVMRKNYDPSSDETTFTKVSLPYITYSVGDIVYGELVNYIKTDFSETLLNEQEYFVTIPYDSVTKNIVLKYDPFIKIKIRDFGSEIITQNLSATTVEIQIPSYAVLIDSEGNYVWKDLLDFGYVDPLDLLGVNFPFVNGTHYVHDNYILAMEPDMTDTNTNTVFGDIHFSQNQLLNALPTTGLLNAGSLCQ